MNKIEKVECHQCNFGDLQVLFIDDSSLDIITKRLKCPKCEKKYLVTYKPIKIQELRS